MKFKLISLIVLSSNQINYIYKCIDSILTQDYPNIELIVLDDASYDFNTKEIRLYIDSHRNKNISNIIICKNQKRLGLAANYNQALMLANGDFSLFLLADEYLHSYNSITAQISFFDLRTNLVCARKMELDNQQCESGLVPNDNAFFKLAAANSKELYRIEANSTFSLIPLSATIWRTSFLRESGGFIDKYVYLVDKPLWLHVFRLNEKPMFINLCAVHSRTDGILHQSLLDGFPNISREKYLNECLEFAKNNVIPVLNKQYRFIDRLICTYKCQKLQQQILKESRWNMAGVFQNLYASFTCLPLSLCAKIYTRIKNIKYVSIKYEAILAIFIGAIYLFQSMPYYQTLQPLLKIVLLAVIAVLIIKAVLNVAIFLTNILLFVKNKGRK